MNFETFKTLLLSSRFFECDFCLCSSNKKGTIEYFFKDNKKKYRVKIDQLEFYFDEPMDILNEKIFDNKTIAEVWNDIEFRFIEEMTEEDYLDYIRTPNFF